MSQAYNNSLMAQFQQVGGWVGEGNPRVSDLGLGGCGLMRGLGGESVEVDSHRHRSRQRDPPSVVGERDEGPLAGWGRWEGTTVEGFGSGKLFWEMLHPHSKPYQKPHHYILALDFSGSYMGPMQDTRGPHWNDFWWGLECGCNIIELFLFLVLGVMADKWAPQVLTNLFNRSLFVE